MSRHAARFALLFVIVIAAACDKVALLAPTGSTVNLSVGSTAVGANGTAELIATVIESSGTPVHNGTEVTFQTSVGKVEPAVVRTEGGIARTTFMANGASGTARIVAFSGGAQSEAAEVRVGNAAAETVTVRVAPATVAPTGGTVEVSALVRDASGNPLPGATVAFSTDNGTLGANTAVTDANGEAVTTVRTTRQTVVTATVAGATGTATIGLVNLPTATVTVTPQSPVAGAPVTITVTPGSAQNGNPVQNVIVDFGDGSTPANLGAISSAQTVSHVYSRAGTFTITVTVVDTAGQRNTTSTVVSVQSAVVAVSVTASPSPATAGTPVTVSATATPAAGQTIVITSIRLEYGDGQSTTHAGSTVSAQHVYESPGTYTIRAVAIDGGGNQHVGTTQLTVNPRAAITVELDATPTQNSGDATAWNCNPQDTFPKTCEANLSEFVPQPGMQPVIRVVFTARISGGLVSASSFQWDFGDGTTETTTSASRDHAYTVPNTYVIRVRVTATDGSVGEQRLTLIVRP